MSGMQQCRWTRVLLVALCGALAMAPRVLTQDAQSAPQVVSPDVSHARLHHLTRFAPQLFRTS